MLDARCMYRFKLQRITRQVRVTTPEMIRGRFVHDVLHEYVRQCVDGKMDSDAETLRIVLEEKRKTSGSTDADYEEFREPLFRFAERPCEWRDVLALECREDVDIGAGMKCQVVIDRANLRKTPEGTLVEIVDYKTSAKVNTAKQVSEDPQLNLYRYAAANHLWPGNDFYRVGIYHVRYNKIVWGSPPKRLHEFGPQDEAVEDRIRRNWQKIHETPVEEMLPEKGPQCDEFKGCPVRDKGLCPAFSEEAVVEMASGSIEDRVRACRRMKGELNKVVTTIRADMLDKEPIVVDGKLVGYKESDSWSYPLQRFLEFAQAYGIPLAGINLTKSTAEKAIKKATLSVDQLRDMEAASQKIVSTRFTY